MPFCGVCGKGCVDDEDLRDHQMSEHQTDITGEWSHVE
jgi:hypothetical protein